MGLRAALLLARGRPEGAFLISMETPCEQAARARHSFLALLFCVPIFMMMREQNTNDLDVTSVREFASFVLAWLGYAVLSYQLASVMGRAEDWLRFVVLWNWCNLVQYLLIAFGLAFHLVGAPPIIGQTAWVVAMGWSLWLQWSATRIGLNLRGGRAALMVGADMAVGMVMLRLTAG